MTRARENWGVTAPMRDPAPVAARIMHREETESLLRRLALIVAVLFVFAVIAVAVIDRNNRNDLIDRNAEVICHYGDELNLPPAPDCPTQP